jgi:Nuclease-related domain
MPLDLPPTKAALERAAAAAAAGSGDPDDEPEVEMSAKPDYLYSSNEEVVEVLKRGDRVLGTPGASLTWGIDGDRMKPQIDSGIEGEKQTAAILAGLAEKIPQMFVFHSLSWPESNGDTDHIVVYGSTVLVIDSKRWKGSRKYTVTPQGTILRGTVAFPQGKVKIGYALSTWRKKLPAGLKVNGVVCIAQEKVFVPQDRNWHKAPFRLVAAENLEEFLMNTFKKNPVSSKTPASLLLTLAKLLVKPRDRRAELIRVGGERRAL